MNGSCVTAISGSREKDLEVRCESGVEEVDEGLGRRGRCGISIEGGVLARAGVITMRTRVCSNS